MKKRSVYLFLLLIVILFSCRVQRLNNRLQSFEYAFADVNNYAKCNLMLYGDFKDDLSKLKLDNYINFLKQDQRPTTIDVLKTLQKSDSILFVPQKNTFFIVIYSKYLHVVIFDDARTPIKVDSVKPINKNELVPILATFIKY